MNDLSSLVLIYAGALFVMMAAYLFHLCVSAVQWDESEIRLLERLELHLAHILRLLEAPDVRMLLQKPRSRQRLFLDFTRCLRDDVIDLLRSRKLEPATLAYAGTFFLCYYLIRVKGRFSYAYSDLRFLSGLELALFRRLEKTCP